MPIICATLQTSTVSVLIYKTDEEIISFSLPFVYCSSAYASFLSPKDYYIKLFDRICYEYKIPMRECSFFLAGFLDHGIDLPFASVSFGISELLASSIDFGFFPIVVDNYMVAHASGSLFATNNFSKLSTKSVDLISNMNLYPNLIPNVDELYIVDSFLRLAQFNKGSIDSGRLLFTGSRFNSLFYPSMVKMYLLAIDIIKNFGAYEFNFDHNNVVCSLLLLEKAGIKKTVYDLNKGFISFATVVKSTKAFEALIKDSNGTSKLIEVKGGKIEFIPIENYESVDLIAKGGELGLIDKNIMGGLAGLVLDARKSISIDNADILVLENSLNQVLSGI